MVPNLVQPSVLVELGSVLLLISDLGYRTESTCCRSQIMLNSGLGDG